VSSSCILGIYNFVLSEVDYRNVFIGYRIGYWLALSLAVLIGYIASSSFPSERMDPNGFEYFVTLSSIGPILQCILTFVANVLSGDALVPTGTFVTEEISTIVEIGIQVVFYAHVKTVQILPTDDNEDSDRKRRRLILMGVIWYFVVCNFALWVEDSFIETRVSETSWQKQFFDSWPLVYNIFNPFTLVFRFNSALLFLNVLFDKKLAVAAQ